MAVPVGSMARGEVQIIPFSITADTTAKVDLTPGAYDIMVIHSATDSNVDMYVDMFVNEEQSAYAAMWMMLPSATAETGVVGLQAVVTTTPLCVFIVPRTSNYIPVLIPYGIQIRYSGSVTATGFVVCRRR